MALSARFERIMDCALILELSDQLGHAIMIPLLSIPSLHPFSHLSMHNKLYHNSRPRRTNKTKEMMQNVQ